MERVLLFLLFVIYGHQVTSSETLPNRIMVQCGTQQCNILEEFCSLDYRCDNCNEDECKLPLEAGERPPQCFFKCNQVMEKLKHFSNDGFPTWLVYILIAYAVLVTSLFVVLLVWMCRKKKTGYCVSGERQALSEETTLVSQFPSELSESQQPVQEPSRGPLIIASPQNDREIENNSES